jgi:uncharacterized protein (TIGR03086 family)
VTEISDRYSRRAAAFSERVEAVPDDRWDDPSPCEEWVARDIVQHMVDNASRFYALVGREVPPGPSVADDPVGAWKRARDAIQEGLDDPAVATLEYDGQMGRGTFEQGVDRFAGPDLVIHAWDLARATGGDERLDPDDVHAIYEAMQPMDEVMRTSGAMGPKLEPPPGADAQTRLLAFSGRRA